LDIILERLAGETISIYQLQLEKHREYIATY